MQLHLAEDFKCTSNLLSLKPPLYQPASSLSPDNNQAFNKVHDNYPYTDIATPGIALLGFLEWLKKLRS